MSHKIHQNNILQRLNHTLSDNNTGRNNIYNSNISNDKANNNSSNLVVSHRQERLNQFRNKSLINYQKSSNKLRDVLDKPSKYNFNKVAPETIINLKNKQMLSNKVNYLDKLRKKQGKHELFNSDFEDTLELEKKITM